MGIAKVNLVDIVLNDDIHGIEEISKSVLKCEYTDYSSVLRQMMYIVKNRSKLQECCYKYNQSTIHMSPNNQISNAVVRRRKTVLTDAV